MSENKTHGVLTDQEIHDLGLIAMQSGWPDAEFARVIEVAVLEKVGVSRIAEDRIYDLLSEIASIDTHDINLRDHPDAYAAVEAAVLAKAAPQSPVAPADECAAFVGWLSASYPLAYDQEEAERLWRLNHVAALSWQARARIAGR